MFEPYLAISLLIQHWDGFNKTSEFTRENLFPLIDRWAADVQARVKIDRSRWGSASELDFPEEIQELKSFIEKRGAFEKSALPRLRQ